MLRLILIRHGHVEGILPERFRGRLELPLTTLGRAQATATAQRIAQAWRPSAIYTSPMQRCIDTGKAISLTTSAPATPIADLADLDYGAWTGRTWEEVRAEQPEAYDLWFERPEMARPGGADTLQDLVLRTAAALRDLIARHPGQTVVMVGHDSTNRALLLQLLDQPLSAYWRIAQSPCGVSEAVIERGRTQVLRLNETAHLEMSPDVQRVFNAA